MRIPPSPRSGALFKTARSTPNESVVTAAGRCSTPRAAPDHGLGSESSQLGGGAMVVTSLPARLRYAEEEKSIHCSRKFWQKHIVSHASAKGYCERESWDRSNMDALRSLCGAMIVSRCRAASAANRHHLSFNLGEAVQSVSSLALITVPAWLTLSYIQSMLRVLGQGPSYQVRRTCPHHDRRRDRWCRRIVVHRGNARPNRSFRPFRDPHRV